MLRDSEKLIFQFKDLNKDKGDQGEDAHRYYFMESDDDDLEAKQDRLRRGLKEKLVYKQNNVPKKGKGKYDVTVPVLFEFLKNPNERKSTRQLWLESEVQKKEREINQHLDTRIVPTNIPSTTTRPLYKLLLKKDAQRR
jgi:hypothetical protein